MTLEERQKARAKAEKTHEKTREQEKQREEKKKERVQARKNGQARKYQKKEGITYGRPRKENTKYPRREKKPAFTEYIEEPTENETTAAGFGGFSDLQEVERVTDAGKPSIEEICRRIDDAIEEYKHTPPALGDDVKIDAFIWANMCHFIGQKVFHGKNLLQEEKRKPLETPAYIYDRVNAIYNYYLFLTARASAVPRICDFARMIDVSEKVLNQSNTLVTPAGCSFGKNITIQKEQGLESMLMTRRGNMSGVAMILNSRFGWTRQSEVIHTDGGARVGARDLPKLGTTSENTPLLS